MTTYFGKFAKKALPVAVSMALLPTATVFAAEESAEQVERIQVTGSRIKRIDMEAATPVVTIDAAAMEASGFSTVSDVLRNSSLNSFGSFGGGSNNSYSSQAQVALKGADARQTLVLIDGVRLSKSPITGGSANLNMIPTAAVARIDVLTDGASAVYGSDAVAGVINIILKKDYEGLEFSAKGEFPDTIEGSDSKKFTFTGGTSSDKASMVFSWEHYEEEEVLFADIDYARAQLKSPELDPAYIDNWHGLSTYARALWDRPLQGLNAENNCEIYGEDFKGPFKELRYADQEATICGYDWTKNAQAMPETRRDSMMASLKYDLTDDVVMSVRGMWMDQTTTDISAPNATWIQPTADLPERNITVDGTDLTLVPVEAYSWMKYRLDTAGNRNAEHKDNSLDLVVGFEGSLGDATWDFSTNYARYEAFTWGTNYASGPALATSIGSLDEDGNWQGWDPREPGAVVPKDAIANFDKRRKSSQVSVRGGIQFDVVELPAGVVSAYVGASHSRETYYSKIDGQAEAGNVEGGNGGSGGEGSRTISAAFVEAAIPLMDNLDLNFAGRFDEYSDFGSTFNPQVSISYRPVDELLLRASAGTGFQAPMLTDLYSDNVRGVEEAETDYIGCYQEGIDVADCEYTIDYWGTTGGNRDLQPEESESTNFGIVYEFVDNWSVSADYWTLDVEKRVDSIGFETIQLMQVDLWKTEGSDAYIGDKLAGVDILYKDGIVDEIISPKSNSGNRESAGLDVRLNGLVESDFGDFKIDLSWSRMEKFKTSYINSEGQITLGDDELGEVYRPQQRVNSSLTWTLEDHSVNLYSYYIDSQEDSYIDDTTGEKVVTDSLDSFVGHNLTYTYNAPYNARFSVGILNVLDKETPRRSADPRTPFGTLYDIRGRVLTVSYTQSF